MSAPTRAPSREPGTAPPASEPASRAGRAGSGVGGSPRRPDGVPKVTGQFAYGSDLWMDDMIWGVTLRSPHAHARISSIGIGIGAALATAGVYAVLTHEDVPGDNRHGLGRTDQPVLARRLVRYQGEPVALVAADHPEIARQAAKKIAVSYAPLPPVTDPVAALEPGASALHAHGNLVRHLKVRKGDPHPPADVVVTGEYRVGMQDQAFLGPEAGMAVPDGHGGVDLYVATQWLHVDQKQICSALRLPPEKVRLVVDVDTELGLIKVVELACAQDVGKAMHPQAILGQIHGGTAQGMGLAIMGEIQVSGGLIQNPSFTDYLIPTILDMPPMRVEILEYPDPHAPYGLRGVGEPPAISSGPAVAAAIRAATGLDLPRIPIKPEHITDPS
jgi:CO/xanthine dehydrogenase Mo-binding subunit